MRITDAETKIVRGLAVIAACNGDTRTATQIARDAVGSSRWNRLDGSSVRDAIRSVDAGRRVAQNWHSQEVG